MTDALRSDPLADPTTGDATGVAVRVFGDGVFILDPAGETLATLEVVASGGGQPELVVYLRDPNEPGDADDPQWTIHRVPARVHGDT